MDCPVCCTNAQQIATTIDRVSIVCPMCGGYDISRSVIATGQLQTLEPETRRRPKQGEAFGAAGRSPDDYILLARLVSPWLSCCFHTTRNVKAETASKVMAGRHQIRISTDAPI
jgi:predicted RNA-binding Zn-ribbon protein involved in translation (DUF1610 family)